MSQVACSPSAPVVPTGEQQQPAPKRAIKPSVDPENCFGCGACMISCPQEAISMQSNPAPGPCHIPTFADSCTACGTCVKVCGYGAISQDSAADI